ncbi:MAG: type II secretion system F family protein [bacterium]
MPMFEYLARSTPEKMVQGAMQAESANLLAAQLAEKGLFPVEIVPLKSQREHKSGFLLNLISRKNKSEVILFTRQLANMLEAGMTVHSALFLLQKQASKGSFARVLPDLLERLQDGSRFSEACAAWTGMFSKFYVNMIKAGEAGGMLELVLEHLANYLEKEDSVQKQIRAALAYPLLMLSMGILTVTILLTFVVPQIVTMFHEIGQTLPLPTKILLSVSNSVSNQWPLMLLAGLILATMIKIKYTQNEFKLRLDKLKLRLPFFGSLIIQAEITQFARTMSALLAHGVPIHQAFEVVVAACKNLILQQEFSKTAEAIRSGGRMGDNLAAGDHLPALLGQMISIAEDTNQLEKVLNRIAKSNEQEVERRVSLFTRLLEPAMIILIGAVIGFIVFAMMMPIFQIDFVVQ